MLILPIILLIIILLIKFKIKIDIISDNSIGNKKEKVYFDLILKNNSIFPISNCQIRISYYNNFDKKVERKYILVPANSKSTQKISCNIISEHCGNISVNIEKIKIYDYLKLFSVSKRIKSSTNLSILPEIHQINELFCSYESEVAAESQYFSTSKSGDDPSEVFAIREYKEGDKLQRVHWKLSTKYDELMVKEFSLPLVSDGIIFIELFSNMKNLKVLDSIIETTISISYNLLANNLFHYIAWYDNEKHEFYKIKIDSEEELFSTIHLIMSTKPYSDKLYTLTYFNSLNENMHYSASFYITPEISQNINTEIARLSQGLTVLFINDNNLELDKINSITQMDIEVYIINTDSIKENINRLAI
jgi:hypothetical protein